MREVSELPATAQCRFNFASHMHITYIFNFKLVIQYLNLRLAV